MLQNRPNLVCDNPYDKAWIAGLKPTRWEENAAQLWNAAQYLDALREEIAREANRTAPQTQTKP